jgi:tRNA modification GTPase
LREATDVIEGLGVERTREKLKQAAVIVYLFDLRDTSLASLQAELSDLRLGDTPLILVGNKVDELHDLSQMQLFRDQFEEMLFISAKAGDGLAELESRLLQVVQAGQLQQEKIVANARHEQALGKAAESLLSVQQGLQTGISSELVAQDIRRTLHFLGEITGEVSTDDLLGNIFSKFCIGK